MVDSTAPADPSSFAATPGDTEVTLNWTDPEDDDLAAIELTWTPVEGETQPKPVDPGQQSATVTGLTNGVSYTFTARAVDTSGNRSDGVTDDAEPAGLPDCTPTGDNLAVNGDFETGDFSCIVQFPNGGTQAITTDNPSSGTYAANLNVVTPESNTIIKFANLSCFDGGGGICIGDTYPENQTIYISFDMRGALQPGGTVIAELFSETSGGGVSKSEILFAGPISPDASSSVWTNFSTTATTGSDTSGGITLQLQAATGAGSLADVYFDNVRVSTSP